MKSLYKILIFSLLSISTFAQQASEIDPKFLKLPRYNNLAAITNVVTGIATPTQGMMVYNIGTASNWYYNGSAWTNTATSLPLPYLQIQSSATPLISLTNSGISAAFEGINTGTGAAGRFTISNPANASTALASTTDGSGKALTVVNNGTGGAGMFQITNISNTNDVINSTSLGTGIAGNFVISNGTSTSSSLKSSTNGLGIAGHFQINNAASASDGLYSETNGSGNAVNALNIGTGSAGRFEIFNATNGSNVLNATTNGLGLAGNFSIQNTSNTNAALNALTTGTGRAAYFQGTNALETNGTIKFGGSGVGTIAAGKVLTSDAVGNATWQSIPAATAPLSLTSTATTLSSTATGASGQAGEFLISNTSSGAFALTSKTNGLGRAVVAEINNATNASAALLATTNGTGRAIDAINSSSSVATIRTINSTDLGPAIEINGGIKVSGTNKAAFKITTNTAGGGNTSGNVLTIPNTTLANSGNDILIVTHNFSPNSTLLNKAYGVYWSGANWGIYLEDGSVMPNNITFNVLVIKQ